MDVRFRRVDIHDYASTRQVVDDAFKSQGSEDTAAFLDALRADGCILGEWLAEDSSGPIGHIVFSRVWLKQSNGNRLRAAMLTPLAVRPDRQQRGVGMRLMQHALETLEAQGETLFFVLGHPDYYPRVGFRPASPAGIESPWPGSRAFMVRGCFVPEGKLVMPSVIANAH
jgi:putative acetyltransferase